jgi:HD-GYP domain-containing protein (c-di-GMP phosphodiesterase class II)
MPEERKRALRIVAKAKTTIQGAFDELRLGKLVRVEQLAFLVEEIAASITRNPFALSSVTHLKARHEYTFLHSIAVCALMISLARRLKLEKSLIQEIGLAGLLHDLGKAVVPTHLLDKPAALSAEEFATVRTHSERGHALLGQDPGIGQIVLDVVRHHHERIDGTGYPDRLRGEEISIHARMSAICDVYDALTSARSYKDAWSPSGALRLMQDNPGQFDPDILDAFIHSIGIYPVGGLVRLRSDRLAVVLDANLDDPLSPPVRAFFCTISRRHLTRKLCRPGQDEIIGIERPDRWGFSDWAALRRELMDMA